MNNTIEQIITEIRQVIEDKKCGLIDRTEALDAFMTFDDDIDIALANKAPATIQPVECREAYEKWALETGYDSHQHSASTFETAWKAWQAAWNCAPMRESGDLTIGEKSALWMGQEIKRANFTVLPECCPKCGDHLIHNNTGIECGALRCDYKNNSIEGGAS